MEKMPVIPIKWINEMHDSDGDGVPNYRDCDILNPHKHTSVWRMVREQKKLEKQGLKRCISCNRTLPFSKFTPYQIGGSTYHMDQCKKCFEESERKHKKMVDRAYRESEKLKFSGKEREGICPRCGSENTYEMGVPRAVQKARGAQYYWNRFECNKCGHQFYRK